MQANGLTLSAGNVVIVCVVSTLAAIGSASIPNSALVSMITVLQAVGMSQFIPNLSLLFALDWLIGRCCCHALYADMGVAQLSFTS